MRNENKSSSAHAAEKRRTGFSGDEVFILRSTGGFDANRGRVCLTGDPFQCTVALCRSQSKIDNFGAASGRDEKKEILPLAGECT